MPPLHGDRQAAYEQRKELELHATPYVETASRHISSGKGWCHPLHGECQTFSEQWKGHYSYMETAQMSVYKTWEGGYTHFVMVK